MEQIKESSDPQHDNDQCKLLRIPEDFEFIITELEPNNYELRKGLRTTNLGIWVLDILDANGISAERTCFDIVVQELETNGFTRPRRFPFITPLTDDDKKQIIGLIMKLRKGD